MYDDSIWNRIGQMWSLLTSGSLIWIIFVLFLSPMNWLTEAYKWRFLLSKIKKITLFTALGSVMSGMSFALISPGKVGDFAGRILFLDSHVRWRAFFMTIVGSFSHMLVTTCMGAIGLIYLSIRFPSPLFIGLLVGAVLMSFIGVAVFLRINALKVKARRTAKGWWRKVAVSIEVVKRYGKKDLIKVLLISLFKFMIYCSQFVLVSQMLGAELGYIETFLGACVMFWLIMAIPSFFMADVIIRGMIASLVFEQTGLLDDSLPFISASYVIWLVNWVVPASMGGIIFFMKNLLKK